MFVRIVKLGAIGLLALVLVIQVVPYGRDHSNPVVRAEPGWDSTQTRELAVKACYDCHSNETTWPWYSNVAPVSWLVQRDVDEGRAKLNFSEWGTAREQEVDEAGETIQEGEMPPWFYVVLHPNAKLSAQERDALISGFNATFGTGSGEEDEDD